MNQHLSTLFIDVLRLALWLAILSAIFVPLERLFPLRRSEIFRRQFGADLLYYFMNSLIVAAAISAPLAFIATVAHNLLPVPYYAEVADLPLWLKMVMSLVVAEAGFYWAHRIAHMSSFLWRFHAIHHSAEQIDFMVNTRGHVVDLVLTRLCGLAPLYILGLADPGMASGKTIPLLIGFFGILWGFFIHANVRWRLGLLEYVISTPAFHHWHHTLGDPRDRNFASMLPFLDKIFGTLHLPSEWPESYGVDHKVPSSVALQVVSPFLTRN